jgi:hypothetical protein
MSPTLNDGIDYPDVDKIVTDNEFVNLVRDITDLSLRKDLDFYLRQNPLTPRAMHKLKVFYRGVINMGIVVSNIRNSKEFERLVDKYNILRVELPLGLTLYDMNDSFTHVIDIIDLNFLNQLYRATGGFHMRRISTQTNEQITQEASGQAEQQQSQSVWQRLNVMQRK